MGLEKIRQSVLAEARTEAARIIDSAKKDSAAFLTSQKEAADQESERLYKLRIQAIEEEYHRKLIQLKGTARKQILDRRNTVLKSLFERAREEILGWPAGRYAAVMRGLVKRAAGGQGGRIRVYPAEKGLFEEVLSELNQGRGDTRVDIDPWAPLPEHGGFIFVSETFEVDYTLGTMLKEIEYDLLPAIASELFPG